MKDFAATWPVSYHTCEVGKVKVFYREAGDADAPVILLLHGFPTSSHMFRNLIPELAGSFHVIAPDLPGFGQTEAPPRGEFAYTFENLAKVMEGFIEKMGLKRYAVYVFDYGAPTGFRLAFAHPERVAAIVTQNGNAYVEGLSGAWDLFQAYWRSPTAANREACGAALSAEAIRDVQYLQGTDATRVSPDGYTLDISYMSRPGARDIQLDLISDYQNNVALYPSFQRYFRAYQPPTLAVWGRNDPFFLPAGAQAYRRDNPNARVVLYDTGHFALETHAAEIGAEMRAFLGDVFGDGRRINEPVLPEFAHA